MSSHGGGRSIVYIIIAIIVLGIVYWAATKYWAGADDYGQTETRYICPDGMAYSPRAGTCPPGAEPKAIKVPIR